MKGMVFTELIDLAEGTIGEEAVDDMLDGLDLSDGGAYSTVGNYPCSELIAIVDALSRRTGLAGGDLQRLFGRHMLRRFAQTHPTFFEGKATPLHLLDAIEGEVHAEMRKLYPDAELPRFETLWLGGSALRMTYRSQRPLADFCHGLIEGCAEHFGQPLTIARQDGTDDSAMQAVFHVALTG